MQRCQGALFKRVVFLADIAIRVDGFAAPSRPMIDFEFKLRADNLPDLINKTVERRWNARA